MLNGFNGNDSAGTSLKGHVAQKRWGVRPPGDLHYRDGLVGIHAHPAHDVALRDIDGGRGLLRRRRRERDRTGAAIQPSR